MWYHKVCSGNPRTEIIQTERVNAISDLHDDGGSVLIEAGVAFFQLAENLHVNSASMECTLVKELFMQVALNQECKESLQASRRRIEPEVSQLYFQEASTQKTRTI